MSTSNNRQSISYTNNILCGFKYSGYLSEWRGVGGVNLALNKQKLYFELE